MKVLIVLHGLDVGGAQQMVYELIQEIDREDIELLCYGGRQNTLIEKETEKKVHVTYLNEKGKATIKKTLRILRSIKKINPDVVHAHLGGVFYSLIWAYIFRGRLVVTAHAKPEKAFSRMIEPWLKKLLKNNRIQIVTVSEENCALMQKYLGYTDHRIQYVNNGVCIRRFYREPHVGFTYINVARHDENKNQEAIIRCFRKIHELNNDTRLILLGDGPMHNKLKELVDQYTLGDCVQLPGMVSDTAKYYAKSDVYVQSSHREALPMSMLEAMAAGLPLVATDVGGLRDIVKRNGYLVGDYDEEALFSAMNQMRFLSADEYSAMQNESKKLVRQYSSDNMAERYLSIYRMLMER